MEGDVYVWVGRVSRLGKIKNKNKVRYYILVPEPYGAFLHGLTVKVTVEVLPKPRQRGI